MIRAKHFNDLANDIPAQRIFCVELIQPMIKTQYAPELRTKQLRSQSNGGVPFQSHNCMHSAH